MSSNEPRAQRIRQIVSEAGFVQAPPPPYDRKQVHKEIVDSGGRKERRTYETHDVGQNVDSVTYLGLNDVVVWPGSLVRGERVRNFVYEPILVGRAPLDLSISLEGATTAGTPLMQRVENPGHATVQQGISELLKKSITPATRVPARAEFKHQQIYDQSQTALFVGTDLSYGAGSLDATFNWDSSSARTKIIAMYKQVYFTIDVEPVLPEGWFADDVDVELLRATIGSGPPVYISSVTYGMMAFVFVETEEKASDMDFALTAAYKGALDARLDAGRTVTQVLERSSFQTVVYGGSTKGLADLERGYEGFLNVVNASTDFTADSPGVPLSYTFRNVKDHSLVAVTLTSQFTLEQPPVPLSKRIRVKSLQFTCLESDDEGPNNDVDIDRMRMSARVDQKRGAATKLSKDWEPVFTWSDSGGGYTMPAGRTFEATGQADFELDLENYDFEEAILRVSAYVRDYDAGSADEDATSEVRLVGSGMIGTHTISLACSDFKFSAQFEVAFV